VLRPGDALALDIHVVSDLRTPLTGAVVRAVLSWPGGEHSWAWEGDVGPDDCVRVGTVQAIVPDAEGACVLQLTMEHPAVTTTNRYESTVVRRDVRPRHRRWQASVP